MAGGKNTSSAPDKIDLLAEQLAQFQTIFTSSLAEFTTRVESLERRSPECHSPGASSGGHASVNSGPVPPPPLKLDVPRFDGSNPHSWIFKINQFFTYHRTPEDKRVTVASFSLAGAALSWYQ